MRNFKLPILCSYRLWMDQCAVYDGFMTGGCTTLRQGEWEVGGIRLTGAIESMTNSTVAIFGLEETDYQIWNTYPIGSSAKTKSDNFYVLNGQALYFEPSRRESFICIERTSRPKFCRHFRHEQNVSWDLNGIEIRIQATCGKGGRVMVESNCYEPILPDDCKFELSLVNSFVKCCYSFQLNVPLNVIMQQQQQQ